MMSSCSGDRFPVLPPSGHPARRLFLDSSSSLSATRFFGALMGGGQQMNSPARYVRMFPYFRNNYCQKYQSCLRGPRPWRSRNRLQKQISYRK